MVSVIICSINDQRFAAVHANLSSLLAGKAHEIIRISDARSLAQGYTRGFAASRGEQIIFCHDDIEILTPEFASRLDEHLKSFDIVGVAGTNRLVAWHWGAAGPPYVFGQVAHVHSTEGFVVDILGTPARSIGGIHAMDGVFLAARRQVLEKVSFDAETFDGFHHYDLDFTFASYLAGFRLGVVNDIPIIHGSKGQHDAEWRKYAERFRLKYAGRLQRQAPRPSANSWVHVRTKPEVLEVMNGTWQLNHSRQS